MNHLITEDRSKLILNVDSKEQSALQDLRAEDPEYWGTHMCEYDTLDQLMSNSELEWVDPADTGDLTDAPLIGITAGEDENVRVQSGPHGAMLVGGDENGSIYAPILERWGYEPYCLRSFLDDLADNGQAVFIDQW